ncbi:MAG: trypsin-like peptidase domain-containing protein [Sandaracinus sp.]|nr:trypsin-like peptidase domain-containing protein [Sandaracinus sp.]MCB9620828.1 trypsin-like peptidase domain-containing protein [Sandaracinus sp.]
MLVRVALGLWCASAAFGAAHAQPRGLDELTDAHAVAARATALVLRPNPRLTAVENSGTGWVTSLAGIKVVITNRHVVSHAQVVLLQFHDGQATSGDVLHVSSTIDMAVILPREAPRVAGLRFHPGGNPLRGERVVLCGHPLGFLRWVTTEGVVAGVATDLPVQGTNPCGDGQSCVLLDAEAERGVSGGPVVDRDGYVIGMVWGIIPGTSLTLAIHTDVLARELLLVQSRVEEALARRAAASED